MMKVYVNDCMKLEDAKRTIQSKFFMFESEIKNDPPRVVIEEVKEYFQHSLVDHDSVILTCSEVVVLVLMKAIRQRFICNKDIELFFHDGKTWIKIELDDDGELLQECPNGFFEERLELII
jgi:hypothetical protein